MRKSTKFSPEVRERAARMVQEHRSEYPSMWAAIESISAKIGCVPQTLNEWVKKSEIVSGEVIVDLVNDVEWAVCCRVVPDAKNRMSRRTC